MTLTPEQQRAVTGPTSLCVVASAGTGKTTVLTHRFLHLHQVGGIELSRLLAFTFTDKAATEMRERVLAAAVIPSERVPALRIGTVHAFCGSLLRAYGRAIGLSPDFEIAAAGEEVFEQRAAQAFMVSRLAAGDVAFRYFVDGFGVAGCVRIMLGLLKQDLLTLETSEIVCAGDTTGVPAAKVQAFLAANREFQEELVAAHIGTATLSFDELEILSLRLFEQNPAILTTLQQRFAHILVDEFQDIAPRQFRIIRRLFHPEQNTLFVVGDPKQTIYSFRGADVRRFSDVQRLIENHGGQTVALTETFRAPQTLQAFFNALFPRVFMSQGPTSCELFQPGRGQKSDERAGVFAAVVQDDPDKDAALEKLARAVTALACSLVAAGTEPATIAILSLNRKYHARIARCLGEQGLTTATAARQAFFDHPLILLITHVLTYLAGKGARIPQVGILRNVLFGLSEGFIAHVVKGADSDLFKHHTLDLFAASRDREIWHRLLTLLEGWRAAACALTPAELARLIATQTTRLTPEEDRLVGELETLLKGWGHRGLETLSDCVPALKTARDLGRIYEPPGADVRGIRLLTVHAAKGLEFDHVIVVPSGGPGSDSVSFIHEAGHGFFFKHGDPTGPGLLPKPTETAEFAAALSRLKQARDAENARLLYVALTRAKHRLYLFAISPGPTFLKSYEKGSDRTDFIRSFDQWLFWLAGRSQDGVQTLSLPDPASASLPRSKVPIVATTAVTAQSSGRSNQPLGPAVITVTELETFALCPRRFHLRYVKGLSAISAQALDACRAHPATQIARQPKVTARERGNFTHEVLEFYDFSREDNLDTVIDQALFNQHLTDPGDALRTGVRLFITRLKSDPLLHQVLFRASQSRPETAFSLTLPGFVLNGQIDRLAHVRLPEASAERWVILDYKTQVAPNAFERDRLARHFAFQMSCYALAVARQFGQDSVDAIILFTAGPDTSRLHFGREELQTAEAHLLDLHATLTKALQTAEFPLTTDPSPCKGCEYYRGNDCGIRDSGG